MTGWSQTRNLNVACALATCGVDFNHEVLFDEATGTQRATFFLALKNREPAPDDPRPLRISTPGLLRQLREGTLERNEPAHPVLDCMEGLNTREQLLHWLMRGIRCRIVPVAGSNRAITVEGTESSAPSGQLVATPDIKLASALMRCGLPCVGIDGHGTERRFLIRARGLFDGVDGVELARKIRDGSLAKEQPEHPALWVQMALRNRDIMLSMIKRGVNLVLIRDPRSSGWQRDCRSAVVFENASAKALDKVQRHLRIQ